MNTKNTARMLSLPRFGAVGIVFLLLMAGQGSSQTDLVPDEVLQARGIVSALPDGYQEALVHVFGDADPASWLPVMQEDLQGLQDATAQEVLSSLQGAIASALSEVGQDEAQEWVEKQWPDVVSHVGRMFLLPETEPWVENIVPSLQDLQQPMAYMPGPICQGIGDITGDPLVDLLLCIAVVLVLFIVLLVVLLPLVVAFLALAVILYVAGTGLGIAWQLDEDKDGVGDAWKAYWSMVYGVLAPAVDTDVDGLWNVNEFRWELLPACAPNELPDNVDTPLVNETLLPYENCRDFDDDNWRDGPEVAYWNNITNDFILFAPEVTEAGVSFYDPDRTLDSNDNGVWNVHDPDSDSDGLKDGQEIWYGAYPEFSDSDCAMVALECTASWGTTYWDQARLGQPGSGDGINDAEELAFWNTLGPDAWQTDYDEDGIESNLLDPDSDNDGVSDGAEIRAGTNPADPDDGPMNTAAQNDPTNENLPEDQMDPTNLQYLRDGRVDAEGEAEELAAVVDQAISAAIAGNVTEALAVVYEATPVAPLVPNPVQTVELAEDALLALVKCVDTDTDALLDTETTASDTAQCARSVLVPFLDALLGRTVEELPLVGDTVAELRQETLPGIVDTVDSIAPLELQATSEALLTDPVGATQDAVLDAVDLVSNPESLQEAVTTSYAATQVAAADLIPASTRHPQFLYDTVLEAGLDAQWSRVQEANDAAATAGVEPIAVVDSTSFNLYTKRGLDEAITRVPVADPDSGEATRTCIQLSDTDTSTRDASGCDLYATLTVSQHVASSPGGIPSPGKRVTPSLQLETAMPTARFELEALGYLQLPDSPHIIALGYATTGSGQPQSWTGTLQEYDANQAWSDRGIAYASTYDDARTAIPLHLVAGSFEVDVSEPGKPVVDDDQVVLELESPDAPSSVSVDVRRLLAGGEHRVEASIDTNAAASWDVLHYDGLDDHESRLHVAATDLPSGTSRVTQVTHGTNDASWQWTSPAATNALQATYREKLLGNTMRVYDATATDLPGAVLLRADTQSHTHAYQASAAPTAFTLLVGEGLDACPGLTDQFIVVEQDASTLCVVADLDGYTALQVQDLDARFHVTGTRATASTAGTTVLVRDGNTAYAALPASPTSWTGTFATNPGDLRTLDWSASQDLASLDLQADLASELLRVGLTDVPATVSATLDAARGRGDLSASDYVGALDWITSTTGTAPSAATLGDHVRLRERSTGVEASWSVQDIQDVVARVTEDGAWEATGSFASARPLEVYYEDEANRLQLDAASVSGDFHFRVADDADAGLFSYSHDLTAPTSAVTLAGTLGGSNVLVDATSAPSDLTLSTRLDVQSVSIDASGTIGGLEAIYAPSGRHPTSGESNFVVVGGTATARPGLHLDIGGFSALDVTRSPASLTLDSTTTASTPLLLRFEQEESATVLDLDAVPTQVTVAHGEGALTWSSSAATSFDYLARGASASSYLSASATDAPETLSLSWTPRAVDTFQALLVHNGGASLPYLVVEDHRRVAGQAAGEAGFRFEGNDLPAQVAARFEPVQGRLTATATNAGGAPASAGFLDVGFGERRPSRLQAPSASGTLAFLDEADAGIAGALRSTDLESLTVRLFGDEGQPDSAGTVNVQRSSGGPVYVRADSTSRDAHGIVHYASAPADVEALLWPGTGGGGFRLESQSPTTAGALTAKLVREGRSLAASTTFPTPADLRASWTPGAAILVTASSPVVLKVQATPQDASVPGHGSWDHVVARQSAAGSVFALHLSSVTSFTLDPSLGVLDADVGGGVPLIVDHVPGAERLRLEANPLPSSLVASWNPGLRSIDVEASAAMSRFLVSTDPGDGGGQRLLGILDGVPTGKTTFTATPDGVFSLNAPSSLSRARVTSDAGTGAASTLDGDGVRVQASGEQPAFYLNVPGAQHVALVLPAAAAPRLELDASGGSSFDVRLGLPGQRLMGHLDGLPGASVLSWPTSASMLFSAMGVSGGDVSLGYDSGSERGEASVTGAPSSWSLGFTEAGVIDYAGSGSASGLDAFAAWHGAAFKLDADGAPSSLGVVPSSGMQSGTITATGGNVNRLQLALASSGGSGSAAVPSVDSSGRDVFSVDTTSGGGLLSIDLPHVESLSWGLPDSVGRVTGTPLSVDLERSLPSTRPAVVQAVHPDHQSFASFPSGLPAGLDVDLARTTMKWTLGMDSGGKDYVFQHQGGDAGSLRVESIGAPSASTLSFEPKADRSLDYAASGGASRFLVQSRWNGGYVDADLTDAPSKFRVDSGGVTLEDGTVSTLGSGSVGQAQLLVVPSGESDVNRVNPAWEHLAVEVTGKTPYLGLNVAGLSTASWQLPEATGSRPVEGSINRGAGVPGNTWVVLSGPREDVTVKAVDAGSVVSLSVVPSTNTAGNLNPQPLSMDYDGSASRVSASHIHAESGQVASASFTGLTGGASVEATGVEPSFVDVTVGGASDYEFQTTDGGTALHVAVEDATPRLRAEATRGTCGATAPNSVTVSTLGTGMTGPAVVQIGDRNRIPTDIVDNYVHVQCEGEEIGVGIDAPFLDDLTLLPSTCGVTGVTGMPVPADTPVPFQYRDTHGDYNVLVKSHTGSGGLLDLKLGCAGLEYNFKRVSGLPGIASLQFDYTRLADVSSVTGACIQFQDRCVNQIVLSGSGLPSFAEAKFSIEGHESGFTLLGGVGEELDVRIVVDKGEKKDELDMGVLIDMPLDVMRFEKTDQEGGIGINLPSPNSIIRLDDPEQDTLVIKMEKVVNVDVVIDSRWEDKFFHLTADYFGQSGRALEVQSINRECLQQHTRASNLPSNLALDFLVSEDAKYARATASDAKISSVRTAVRIGPNCDPQNLDGLDFFAELESIPAGPWIAGYQLGKAGYLGVKADGGLIKGVDVGIATPGRADEYISLHLKNARFYAEYDFDGDTRFKGNPYYIYCDFLSDRITLRLRSGAFGFGFQAVHPEVAIGCDQFQVGWKMKAVPLCTISISFPTSCTSIHYPKIQTAGSIAFSSPETVSPPIAEILFAGRWYSIPPRLWLS